MPQPACAECGGRFQSRADHQSYCSPGCRERAKWKRRVGSEAKRSAYNAQARGRYVATGRPPGGRVRPTCSVDGCDRPHLARGFCQRHYRAQRYAEGVPWAQGGGYKARARQYGVAYEPINRLVVFRRDGWVCGICGDRVAREDASLDHVIPMSLGGPHLHSNVQCSHLLCNIRKAASMPEEAATL